MKFVLLSVVCLSVAVLAKPAHTKQKRDILPGDPRYGTDYHHHHHAHHENEVEVSRAIGGYAGSYTVRENADAYQNSINFQPPHTAYGPPNHVPGKPIYNPAPQVGQVPVQQQQHHHQQVQVPSYNHQQTSISNFQPSEHVETISNGYLSPVVHSTQAPVVHHTSPVAHYTTPAPYYTTAVPHYTTAVPHYTTSAPQYRPEVHNDYLPPYQGGQQKTVQGPVTSYGTPAPAYQVPEVQPQVEHHDHHVVADVKATVLGDVSSDTVEVASTPVQQEVVQEVHHDQQEETVHDAPVQQDEVKTYEAPVEKEVQTYHQEAPAQTHAHAEAHSHVVAQPAVETKTVQEQVSVHHQPAVHYQPAVHQAVQPAVQRQVVQQTVQQPAVHHQVAYQPQTYSNDYIGSGFDNFGSVNQGFQTYGAPNLQISQQTIPQAYSTDFSNLGFGYQQNLQTYQVPEHSVIGTPQFSLVRTPQIQVPSFQQPEYTQQTSFNFPAYTQRQTVEQIPAYQQSIQAVHQPAITSKTTQIYAKNGGYAY